MKGIETMPAWPMASRTWTPPRHSPVRPYVVPFETRSLSRLGDGGAKEGRSLRGGEGRFLLR